jgi:hypothetical protein
MAEPTRDQTSGLRRAAGTLAGGLPGAVIGATFGAVARLRRTKPLHPHGRVGTGTLHITEPLPHLAVPVLAAEGSHACTVRWSRSVGLPAPLPDIEGLAVRMDETASDLLFASTGSGSVTRYVFAPRRPGRHGPQTTLLPVATGAGPLVFKVEPLDHSQPPTSYALSVAQGTAVWRRVGTLETSWGPDQPLRFDPVENPVPGTEQYPLVRALREPAYLLSRRSTDART